MRTSKLLLANYDRVSRKLFTDKFELEIADRKNSCIFCGEQDVQQSVYYPPKADAAKVLVNGKRGVVAYCCSKHYMRFRSMTANSTIGLTFEDFYDMLSKFGERRSSTGSPIFDKPLPRFKLAADGQAWYIGMGHLNYVRIELPVYEKFKELITSTDIQHVSSNVRRAMFDDWQNSNGASEREVSAFEHFLQLNVV